MSGIKRRFGISVSEGTASSLDLLAYRLGVSRSEIAERALQEYVHDRLHIIKPHHCEGVLVVSHSKELSGRVSMIIEEYCDIVKMTAHGHTESGDCLRILHLRGDSRRITRLERRLREVGCRLTRYIIV